MRGRKPEIMVVGLKMPFNKTSVDLSRLTATTEAVVTAYNAIMPCRKVACSSGDMSRKQERISDAIREKEIRSAHGSDIFEDQSLTAGENRARSLPNAAHRQRMAHTQYRTVYLTE